jgi:hypothetical protein
MADVTGRWQVVDILLKPVGGLLTALSVALVGFWGSRYLEARQAEETNVRLYAELMSNREGADSALRKDMFNMAIATFLDKEPDDLEKLLLELELLAFNFHDALDLAPLFQYMARKVDESGEPDERKAMLVNRLERVAKEILAKQVSVLEDAGLAATGDFDPNALQERIVPVIDATLAPRDFAAEDGFRFRVEAFDVNADEKTVLVRLQIGTAESTSLVDVHFELGFFDFPLIDNSRLPRLPGMPADQRCAVVLRKFDPSHVQLSLLYFPGSRASLKEKPYYDQIIDQLMETKYRLRTEQQSRL